MRPVLGIETASETLSVALVDNGNVLAESFIRQKNAHDEFLGELTGRLLTDRGLSATDCRGIAVSSGPGSFTGLRIGMSFAKGIAFGAGIPLATVPTFDAVAYRIASSGLLPAGSTLAVLFDARREDVYVALYRIGPGDSECLKPAFACSVYDLAGDLQSGVFLVGNGAGKVREALGGDYALISGELSFCHAGAVAQLGERMIIGGRIADLSACEPDYIKDFFTTTKR